MDTLSRKHRLRQLQERRQQQQQVVAYDKENRHHRGHCQFEEYQLDCDAAHNNNNNHIYTNNNNKSNSNNRLADAGQHEEEEEEEEEFRVFKVVEVRNNKSSNNQYIGKLIDSHSSSKTVTNGQRPRNSEHRHWASRREDGVIGAGGGEDFSIVCSPDQDQPPAGSMKSHREATIYTNHNNHCSTDSSRSTGDSSGFLSEGSAGGGGTQSSMGPKRDCYRAIDHKAQSLDHPQSRQHHLRTQHRPNHTRSSRSKVIEDLDHLMADLLSSRSSGSPTESYMSGAESTIRDSTLTRGRELDYSTLCRDEFSGFIAVESKLSGQHQNNHSNNNHQTITHHLSTITTNSVRPRPEARKPRQLAATGAGGAGGPMLVGVHDTGNNDLCKSRDLTNSYYRHRQATSRSPSSGSSDTDPFEASTHDEIRSSSSGLSTATSRSSHYEQSLDRKLVMCASDYSNGGSPTTTTELKFGNGQETDLSQLLDVYLLRLESIRRLAGGDKSVSIMDLFGGGDGLPEIKVDEEHLTPIEFTHLKQRDQSIKVIQEIEMIEMPIDCGSREEFESPQRRCVLATNVIDGGDFYSRLASSCAPICPRIDWPPAHKDDNQHQVAAYLVDTENQINLEESLLSRLLQKEGKQVEDTTSSSHRHKSQINHHKTNYHHQQHLVNTVKRHLSEFIDSYVSYQRELKAATSFANDWHQNWLFAYKKRPEDEDRLTAGDLGFGLDPKRAKMSHHLNEERQAVPNSDYPTNEPPPNSIQLGQVDLIRYSTLILNKRQSPIKPRYLVPEHISSDQQQSAEINEFYEAQEDRLSELYTSAIESSGQTDACRLLLIDDLDEEWSNSDRKSRKYLGLAISYSSTLVPNLDQKYTFSAYGYSFGTPISMITTRRERLKLIRERITSKISELFSQKVSIQLPIADIAQQQVRFLVNLTNVELINNLPVIQFCAKVAGSLPISVKWFSDEAELSDLSSSSSLDTKFRSLRVRESSSDDTSESPASLGGCQWPIEMHANYDYEYRNDWGSWYRFRRSHGDLLFEIRGANWDKDYNKTYRCVVQNCCSKKECTFTLSKRQLELKLKPMKSKRRNSGGVGAGTREPESELACRRLVSVKKRASDETENGSGSGHALLRTWSQRTLQRPQAQSSQHPADANEFNEGEPNANDARNWPSASAAQTTIGRRSAACPNEVDKFGRDFPYHPENLLKRLEENKFLVSMKCNPKLSHLPQQQQPQVMATENGSPTTDHGAISGIGCGASHIQFTNSFELFTGNDADGCGEIHHRKLPPSHENKPQIEQKQTSDLVPTMDNKPVSGHQRKPSFQRPEPASPKQNTGTTSVDQLAMSPPRPRERQLKQQVTIRKVGDLNSNYSTTTTETDSEPMGRVSRSSESNPAIGQQTARLESAKFRLDSQTPDNRQQVDALDTSIAKTTTTTPSPAELQLTKIQAAVCRRLGGQDSSSPPLAGCSGGQRVTMEPLDLRAGGSSEPVIEQECKPRANVKSLISRFSLA